MVSVPPPREAREKAEVGGVCRSRLGMVGGRRVPETRVWTCC